MRYLKLFENHDIKKLIPFDTEKLIQDIKDYCIYLEDLNFKIEVKDKISDFYKIDIVIDKNSKYFGISDDIVDTIIQIYELIMDTFKNPKLINSHLYVSRYNKGFDFIVYSYDIIKIKIIGNNFDYWKTYEIGKLDNYNEWNKINMEFYYFINEKNPNN